MVHKRRLWSISEVDDPTELARKLTEFTWTLCTGFGHGDLLFLNDSFNEDGAAEFGVIRRSTGEQIESITFGWCNQPEALEFIQRLLSEGGLERPMDLITPARWEPAEQHDRCPHCA